MNSHRFLFAAMLMLLCCPAAAASLSLAPDGADSGNCQTSPCKTLQYAADQVKLGEVANLQLSPGVYDGHLNFYEGRRLIVIGPLDADGRCLRRAAVLDSDEPGSTMLIAQDHATLIVRCLTLRASATAVNMMISRQGASIVDYTDIDIIANPGGSVGTVISAQDIASASCVGPVSFNAPVAVYALAGPHGVINLSCPHTVFADIGYVLDAAAYGVINAALAKWDGPKAGTANDGAPYIVDGATVILSGNMPPGQPLAAGQNVLNGGIVK